MTNVGITIINYPFGNDLYQPFMVIERMVHVCFTHINYPVVRREPRSVWGTHIPYIPYLSLFNGEPFGAT